MDFRFVEICERTYRPSMNQAPILVSKPQSMPNQGCCWGTHGSPFHPRRAGIFRDCFKTCNAQTATYQLVRLEHTAVFQTSSLDLGQNSDDSTCIVRGIHTFTDLFCSYCHWVLKTCTTLILYIEAKASET